MAPVRVDRDVDARQQPDRLCPGAGAVEHDACRDLAQARAKTAHPAPADVDRVDLGALSEPSPEAARGRGITHRHRVGAGDAVGRAEGAAEHVLGVQGGDQLLRLGGREPACLGQPEPVPHLHQAAKILDLLRTRQEHQVADLAEVGRHADLLLEAVKHPHAAHADQHIDLARELLPDAARVAPGGAGAELAALKEHHVDPPARQVVGDRTADHAAADDRYVRGFHARPQNSKMTSRAARLVMSL